MAIARNLERQRVRVIADVLLDAGLPVVEVTANSPDAAETISTLVTTHGPRGLAVGAGTVLDVPAAERMLAAGAEFLVTPHTDPGLIDWAVARGVPMLAGALTPTEVHDAWRSGAAAVKLFPAAAVGPGFLADLRGPFPDILLVPTGGVTADNAGAFVAAGATAVGVGSWLTGGDASELRRRADLLARAVELRTDVAAGPGEETRHHAG